MMRPIAASVLALAAAVLMAGPLAARAALACGLVLAAFAAERDRPRLAVAALCVAALALAFSATASLPLALASGALAGAAGILSLARLLGAREVGGGALARAGLLVVGAPLPLALLRVSPLGRPLLEQGLAVPTTILLLAGYGLLALAVWGAPQQAVRNEHKEDPP